MNFTSSLIRGHLIRRYKRFLSDIELAGGEQITAHVANPGAMTGLAEPGSEVWLSKSDNPKRKLAHSWELVRIKRHLVGVNTGLANKLTEEALARDAIRELTGYGTVRREVRYGTNSRVDFLLTAKRRKDCYVEVKTVNLKRETLAEFPDSVTVRGTKHLGELAKMAKSGARAVMLYIVQRRDCRAFTIAADIDPAYAEALASARADGVEMLCYTCRITTRDIRVENPLKIAI